MACCTGAEIDLKEMRTPGQIDIGKQLAGQIGGRLGQGATQYGGPLTAQTHPGIPAALETMMRIGGYGYGGSGGSGGPGGRVRGDPGGPIPPGVYPGDPGTVPPTTPSTVPPTVPPGPTGPRGTIQPTSPFVPTYNPTRETIPGVGPTTPADGRVPVFSGISPQLPEGRMPTGIMTNPYSVQDSRYPGTNPPAMAQGMPLNYASASAQPSPYSSQLSALMTELNRRRG
jgi:hypothetical protein